MAVRESSGGRKMTARLGEIICCGTVFLIAIEVGRKKDIPGIS